MKLFKNWQSVQLEEIALDEKGAFVNGPFGSDLLTSELVSQGVPVIYIRDIREGVYRRVSNVFITPKKAKELKFCQIEPGDILVAKVGDPPGVAAVYPKGMPTGIVTQDVIKIRVNPKLIVPEYLVYFFNSQKGFEARKPIIVETTRARFGLTQFKEIYIPLPPIAEQKRIAAIAQKCDRLRRTRRYTQQLSDSYLQSVFLQMFGDPLTNSKGWNLSTIGELVKVGTGGTPDRNRAEFYGGSIPWVKTGEVNGNVIYRTEEHLTQEGLKSSNCKLFPIGTIIVAMYGQGLTRGRSAKLGIEATTNQACAAILPNSKLSTDYLWSYLKVSYENLRDLGRGGNQPNLNLDLVKSFKVPLPPLPLQEKFAQIVQRFERLRVQQREADRQAEHLFQTILHRAFRGELESGEALESHFHRYV